MLIDSSCSLGVLSSKQLPKLTSCKIEDRRTNSLRFSNSQFMVSLPFITDISSNEQRDNDKTATNYTLQQQDIISRTSSLHAASCMAS